MKPTIVYRSYIHMYVDSLLTSSNLLVNVTFESMFIHALTACIKNRHGQRINKRHVISIATINPTTPDPPHHLFLLLLLVVLFKCN